jgi:hypothetical protein
VGDINDLVGAVGGTIVCLELIVVLVLLIAINLGIAFGLWWVLKHTKAVRAKIAWATGKYEKAVDKGLNVAAAPVIRTTSFWRGAKAGLHRATHWPRAVQSRTAVESAALPPAPTRSEDSSRAA